MGVLTELVIANVSQTQAIALSSNPSEEFRGIDVKGIDPVKLCELKSVLVGKPYDRAWTGEFEFVAGNKEEGPWVMRFPAELADAIAAVPEEDVESTAEAWVSTGAFELDNWSTMDVIEVLWAMRTLFAAKRDSSVAAFLRMAL